MMSSGGIKKDPPSILQNLNTRWNHDKKHPHPNKWLKGRCRYDNIEVKCICRCYVFPCLGLHHPNFISNYNFICVDSIDGKTSSLNPFYNNLFCLNKFDIITLFFLVLMPSSKPAPRISTISS